MHPLRIYQALVGGIVVATNEIREKSFGEEITRTKALSRERV